MSEEARLNVYMSIGDGESLENEQRYVSDIEQDPSPHLDPGLRFVHILYNQLRPREVASPVRLESGFSIQQTGRDNHGPEHYRFSLGTTTCSQEKKR